MAREIRWIRNDRLGVDREVPASAVASWVRAGWLPLDGPPESARPKRPAPVAVADASTETPAETPAEQGADDSSTDPGIDPAGEEQHDPAGSRPRRHHRNNGSEES